MEDLYGIWTQEDGFSRYFVLFLTNSNSYFVISKNRGWQEGMYKNENLAIEWGSYVPEQIEEITNSDFDPYNVKPRIARINFFKEGWYGSDRNICSLLSNSGWIFVPPNPSEIDIQDTSIGKLVRCQSIDFAPIKL
jgi:hypothetical protein